MENTSYTTLTRQVGLLREIQSVAHNIANLSTTGYRKEGVVFAEYVRNVGPGEPSLSMADASVRRSDFSQGPLAMTGGVFDIAIEGPGFFMVATPDGDRFTRAGAFTPDENGFLVAPDGSQLLDAGGAAIFVPPDAMAITIGADGTMAADGIPISQIGLWTTLEPAEMDRADGIRFNPAGDVLPVENGRILQGFIEGSNVSAVTEIARMIEVQRAYELGQSFLDREDDRVRAAIRTIGQQGG